MTLIDKDVFFRSSVNEFLVVMITQYGVGGKSDK